MDAREEVIAKCRAIMGVAEMDTGVNPKAASVYAVLRDRLTGLENLALDYAASNPSKPNTDQHEPAQTNTDQHEPAQTNTDEEQAG